MNNVYFKKKGSIIRCECGEFEIDLSDYDENVWEHARTHVPDNPDVFITLVDEF
jgi:hypothetical protein